VNINIEQMGLSKVGSEVREPNHLTARMGQFIRCIVCLAIGKRPPIGYEKCTKVHDYQGITSRDVFADYEAFSPRHKTTESLAETLGLVIAFGSGILLICFSVLVVF
jgi:hypothetical protein